MRADAEQNRRRILLAAREIFVHEGPQTPLETIARRAGVGIATLYRRFPTRDDLVQAVAEDVLLSLRAALVEAKERETDSFAALRRFMHAAVELRVGAVMPSMFGQTAFLRALERSGTAPAPLLDELVTECRALGLLRSEIAAGDIILMVARLTRPMPGGGNFPDDLGLAHRQLEIYVDGLRPAAAAARGERLPDPPIGFKWFMQIRDRMIGLAPKSPRDGRSSRAGPSPPRRLVPRTARSRPDPTLATRR